MPHTFRLTYDYLCPFARIANEAVVHAIRDHADWDVTFHPFSLSEVHVEPDGVSVWDRPLGTEGTRGTRAHLWALAVGDVEPDRFLDFHVALFSARHDDGADIDDPAVLRRTAEAVGVDADLVEREVASGAPASRLAEAHAEAVKRWAVFGVPTFIKGDTAVFVRLMERGRRDDIDRVLDMLEWTRLNEYKHTTVPR